jgi:ABC-type bacteriocin/lantibiotic exporter with double-glycine peptidase domain
MSYQNTLLLLSIYAGVSLRIIPSLNRILAASLQIRTNEYVISELREIISFPDEVFAETTATISFEKSIELRNVEIGYSQKETVLKNISLCINKGERILIAGESGAGKTTLLLVLLGFLKPHKGEIYFDGKIVEEYNSMWKNLVGYVPQNPYILDASITENIAFGIPVENIDHSKVAQLIRDLNLSEWVNALPEKSNTIIGEKGVKISGGQRQRISIARILYKESEILIFDEVTNQLDSNTEMEIMNLITKIASRKKTIIMISHRPQIASHFDTKYKMVDGRLEKALVVAERT